MVRHKQQLSPKLAFCSCSSLIAEVRSRGSAMWGPSVLLPPSALAAGQLASRLPACSALCPHLIPTLPPLPLAFPCHSHLLCESYIATCLPMKPLCWCSRSFSRASLASARRPAAPPAQVPEKPLLRTVAADCYAGHVIAGSHLHLPKPSSPCDGPSPAQPLSQSARQGSPAGRP